MKILIVDDELVVLHLISQTIKKAGYDVLTATNENQAYGHIASHGEDIKALFIDLHIPGTNSTQVLEHFSKMCPLSKVAVVTGYNNDEVDENQIKVFQKPFKSGELVAWLQ